MLPQFLTRLRRGLYSDSVKRVFQRTGLEGMISDIYWPIFLRLSNDIQTACVNDVCADFYITDRVEYMRVMEGGIAEKEIMSKILDSVNGDTVFYDIGANIGTFSCVIGTKITNGRVVAFEPHPNTASRLAKNLELNDVPAESLNYAVGDSVGTTRLQLDPDVSDIGAPKHTLNPGKEGESIEVEQITVDRAIEENDLASPSVVKIDVEGAEYRVLRGMEDSLETVEQIYCEVHEEKIDDFGDSPDELHGYLTEHGFTIQTISERPPQYFIQASKER